MHDNFNIANIDKKWRDRWAQTELYKFDKTKPNKFYLLEMFSYPSGAKLHVGHWWNFGLSDSYGRYKRLKGYHVFHPMGFDAFGLPAENYAIKTGIHPKDSTEANMSIMEEQLRNLGGTFNWDAEVKTCDPSYYRWTQWLFLQLYKHNLAYQKYAPVNWCTSCKTTLANEQVVDGHCERCNSEVVKKDLTQWFFKTTEYAEELLEGLNRIDWPERTKTLQRNWIGKSTGSEVDFKIDNSQTISVFTSRVDTLFGVSWIVLAPEHPLVNEITTPEHKQAVQNYVEQTLKKDDIERQSTSGEKTGVFTGAYATHPLSQARVPIYIADYVLASYATGAVMGVAAHDERDFAFATKHNVPIIQVVAAPSGDQTLPFTGLGTLVNSGEFNDLTSEEAKQAITNKLVACNAGRFKTNYKLRDWSVSRQRYWGCPIPIVHCQHCGAVPVPEHELPVQLPYDVDWTPDGNSPLAKNQAFMSVECPKCGKPAHRDADTLDTFVCSTWYQFRYADAQNSNEIFSSDIVNKLCPVDQYVGGIEHATMHLLYARFITKFLQKIGKINFDEPFQKLFHQGIILGSDGVKMSKSRGNTVSADELIEQYGSDAFRLYLMFGFSYSDGGPWNDDGIKSIAKFMERFARITTAWGKLDDANSGQYGTAEKQLDYARHYCISQVDKDMDAFSYNTAVARMMELVNAMHTYNNQPVKNHALMKSVAHDFLVLVSPCCPHVAEELWETIGMPYSVHNQTFPAFDASKLVLDQIEIVAQIRSKIVAKLVVPTSASQNEVETLARQNPRVAELLAGFNPNKTIYIAGKLINFV